MTKKLNLMYYDDQHNLTDFSVFSNKSILTDILGIIHDEMYIMICI